MEQDENRTAIKIHTETDKIRSTPLSGFFLQTSLMEAAILMQIFLSDLNSVKPFGSNTPYILEETKHPLEDISHRNSEKASSQHQL